MLRSSLVFGDDAWNATLLDEFAATPSPDGGGLAVTALSYQYSPQDTPTVSGRIMRNFHLKIEGNNIASGRPFLYRYDQSMQTVTLVPEPATCILLLLTVLTRSRA